MRILGPWAGTFRNSSSFFLAAGYACGYISVGSRALYHLALGLLPAIFLVLSSRQEVYNILWVLVFGFATLNILSLGARRVDAHKSGLHFGEVLAILVVVVSIVMLSWEMLYLYHLLPIRLAPE